MRDNMSNQTLMSAEQFQITRRWH